MSKSILAVTEIDTIKVVKNIASNMIDYEQLLRITQEKVNLFDVKGESINPWHAITLSHGLPGICMLYAELHAHFPNEGWDKIGHQYLSILVKEIGKCGVQTPSMFSGAAGIGLATLCLSQDFTLYQKFMNRINDYLLDTVPKKIYACSKRDIHMSDYDVVEGISGITNYLLLLTEDKRMKQLLMQALQFLVVITEDIERYGVKVPGWYVPSKHHFTPIEEKLYPKGSFNLGLAHGIAGIIIILSKALLQGIKVKGQEHAIKKMVDFLIQFANKDETHLFWKGFISFEEFKLGKVSNKIDFRRDAWCYGNPGVCLALLYAGKALDKSEYTELGIYTLEEAVKKLHGIFSPTFCHGIAGISQILLQANDIIGEKYFERQVQDLKHKLINFYDKTYLFGFHNYEAYDSRGITPVNYIGLLDGSVGVCLSLISIELGTKTKWRESFIL